MALVRDRELLSSMGLVKKKNRAFVIYGPGEKETLTAFVVYGPNKNIKTQGAFVI